MKQITFLVLAVALSLSAFSQRTKPRKDTAAAKAALPPNQIGKDSVLAVYMNFEQAQAYANYLAQQAKQDAADYDAYFDRASKAKESSKNLQALLQGLFSHTQIVAVKDTARGSAH